ncbi:hypothetical protein VTJ83DRAFT_4403 [Remersonia thermophila]|uniref:Chitobiosyldiphosphodolichol beta-mannosyltransferase n=1 Tax=Remersonia thermophila TaxID=72144 RepID=A0ABR4DBC3_9PEZI
MLVLFLAVALTGLVGLATLLLCLRLRPTRYDGPPAGSSTGVSVHVVVLGDLGRSPRMTYHALSFAKHGGKVNLIGYAETSPHPDVATHPNIAIRPLPTPPRRPPSVPFLLFAPFKVLYQLYHLTRLLAYALPPAHWLLVQNPPSIPTLAVALLVGRLRNTKLVVDWHNYGWTILAGTRGASHPLVRLSKAYECRLGRLADLHLTVTHAMARQLRRAPYAIPERLPMLAALARVLPAEHRDLLPALCRGDVRLLVSSTSWTPDEDFSLLLDALVRYAAAAAAAASRPRPPAPILAVITGKGPQRDLYLARVAELVARGRLPRDAVRVATAFLPFEDYAALLACADLGVCLHRSSSGVDLPMKVVDMFGAGLPVAAYQGYESFGELVKEGENGRGFETAEELADILTRLFGEGGKAELERLRKGAVLEGSRRWDGEWDASVGRVTGFVKSP